MRRNQKARGAHVRGWGASDVRHSEPFAKRPAGRERREERRYKATVVRAAEQVEQENVTCATCTGLALEGKKHCFSCDMYWEDCRNGLFLDDGLPRYNGDDWS